MNSAVTYLGIDQEYVISCLRWSVSRDSIEDRTGSTIMVNAEIIALLSGLFQSKRVPVFAQAVFIYWQMKRKRPEGRSSPFDCLNRAFWRANGATALTQNAGLLITELMRDIPPSTVRPSLLDLILLLETNFREAGQIDSSTGETPAPRLGDFLVAISRRLQEFDEDELVHWLKYGQGTSPHIEHFTEAAESIQSRLKQLLAACDQNPRLAGSSTLRPTMDAALTLPPRKRSGEATPQGGYQDVITRGEPERLLPSQFALDPDEFVRRFSSQELLYFKREEPHAPQLPDRVVLLDQGVRTWGAVRLALVAAFLALVKKDAKGFGQISVYFTSTVLPRAFGDLSAEEMARVLEASDFMKHPAVCVRQAVRSANVNEGPCDLILLTHRRNLEQKEVLEALTDLRRQDRFFALAIDESGAAELVEWSRTGFVVLRRLRVDLASAEQFKPRLAGETKKYRPNEATWTGAVEPIPFAFRPGLVAEVDYLGFDGTGTHVVFANSKGILQVLDLSTSQVEVLPRPFEWRQLLQDVSAILPTNAGFVIAGRMRMPTGRAAPLAKVPSRPPALSTSAMVPGGQSPTGDADHFVAAHYDFQARHVQLHDLGLATREATWFSYPDLNCVAVHFDLAQGSEGVALDLTTGEQYFQVPHDIDKRRRAHAALSRRGGHQRVSYLPIYRSPQEDNPRPHLEIAGDTLIVHRSDERYSELIPMIDGQPLSRGMVIWQAVLARDMLALRATKDGQSRIYLIDLVTNALVREIPFAVEMSLSPDASRIAIQRRRYEVIVQQVVNHVSNIATARSAHLHKSVEIGLSTDPFRLVISIGMTDHTFTLNGDRLEHSVSLNTGRSGAPGKRNVDNSLIRYDPLRFPLKETVRAGNLVAAMDRLGQVVLLTSTDELAACFLVRRRGAAVWIPEGFFWGDATLSGAAADIDADQAIGRKILAALGENK